MFFHSEVCQYDHQQSVRCHVRFTVPPSFWCLSLTFHRSYFVFDGKLVSAAANEPCNELRFVKGWTTNNSKTIVLDCFVLLGTGASVFKIKLNIYRIH